MTQYRVTYKVHGDVLDTADETAGHIRNSLSSEERMEFVMAWLRDAYGGSFDRLAYDVAAAEFFQLGLNRLSDRAVWYMEEYAGYGEALTYGCVETIVEEV